MGGGAFSGKDPSKVDRSAAYAARHAARNIVAAELAERVELQVSYAIGKPEPTSLAVHSFGTGRMSDDELTALVSECFDLRPAAIIEHLQLKRPIYEPTASYGHFGRGDLDLPWEQNHHVDAIAPIGGVGRLVDKRKGHPHGMPLSLNVCVLRLSASCTEAPCGPA